MENWNNKAYTCFSKPHEQLSWNKNQFLTFSSHEHDLKLNTLGVLTDQKEKEKSGYLKKVILYNNSTKLPNLKWTQMVRNGKFVKLRK